MNAKEFCKLAFQPLPGHIFSGQYHCRTCKKQGYPAKLLAKLTKLQKVDKQILQAAEHLFSLKEADFTLQQTAPSFEFLVAFCNARQEWGENFATFYFTGVWAGKIRFCHALHVYYTSLSK